MCQDDTEESDTTLCHGSMEGTNPYVRGHYGVCLV